MNHRNRLIAAGIVMFVAWPVQAAFDPHVFGSGRVESPVFDGHAQMCFSRAMVGMDSVINSRLGVPPEQVVALAEKTTVNNSLDAQYDEPLLSIMLTAYLWEGSPHGYAIKVFYDCAKTTAHMADRSDFLP